MMQRPSIEAATLSLVLCRAHELDSARYEQEWLPYLSSFELPVVQVATVEGLQLMGQLLPERAPLEWLGSNLGWETHDIKAWLPHLAQTPCHSIVLYGNLLDAQAISLLVDSPAFEHVTKLDVSGNPIGNQGLIALLASVWCAQLTLLDLSNCQLEGGQAIEALILSNRLQALQTLNLSSNELTLEDRMALELSRLDMPNLSSLYLNLCEISDLVLLAMQDASCWPQLHELHMMHNQVTDVSMTAILPQCAQLRVLNMQNNPLGFASLNQLDALTHLHTLDMSYSQLDDDAMSWLARANLTAQLQWLNLAQTKIGPKGIASLATERPFEQLTFLSLDGNAMDASAIDALAQSDAFPMLQRLDLTGMTIEPQWLDVLRHSTHLPKGLTICHSPNQWRGVDEIRVGS